MEILSRNECEIRIRHYMGKAVDYDFRMTPTGVPCFILRDNSCIVANEDGSVTWFVREISLSLHSFIELRTGERKEKTVYIPLCLVNSVSRQVAKALVNTTIDFMDGRFGSKKAEAIILTPDGKGVVVHFKLKGLPLHYITLQMFPKDHVLAYKSSYCPFCKMIEARANT